MPNFRSNRWLFIETMPSRGISFVLQKFVTLQLLESKCKLQPYLNLSMDVLKFKFVLIFNDLFKTTVHPKLVMALLHDHETTLCQTEV